MAFSPAQVEQLLRPVNPRRVQRDNHGMATDPHQIWYCPVCGGRLSYGVYCKACETETDFQMRPATDLDRLQEELRSTAPLYPLVVLNDCA